MEHCQPIQRSCPPHQLLDESSAHSRTRQPLREAPGNALAPSDALSSIGLLSHDSKATQPPVDRPYSIVPSQPSRQSLGSTLELPKHTIRRQRRNRLGSQNPIVNSPQYIAYRNRQSREGNEHDLKWPAVLEDAFLDGNNCLRPQPSKV
jgi:transcriptional enhancer factor